MPTLYDVLGIHPSVELVEVRAAFKRCALAVHPDKGGSKEAFQQVLFAFETLSDGASRSRYDRKMHVAGEEDMGGQATGESYPRSDEKACGATRAGKRRRKAQSEVGQAETCPEFPNAASEKCHWGDASPEASSNNRCRQPGRSGMDTTSSEKGMARSKSLMDSMFVLLRSLSPKRRRSVLQELFTQQQRLALESWLAASPKAPSSAAEDTEDLSGLALIVEPSDVCDFSDSLSWSESEVLEPPSVRDLSDAEDDQVLALELCDRDDAEPSVVGQDAELVNDVDADGQRMEMLDILSEALTAESHACNNVPGICKQSDRIDLYWANVNVESMRFSSRKVKDLTVALDFLMLLTAMKLRMKQSNSSALFEERVKGAIESVLRENNVTIIELGLTIRISIRVAWCMASPIQCPVYHDVDRAVHAWKRLAQFRWRRGRRVDYALGAWSKDQLMWPDFRKTLISISEEAGHCCDQTAARLDALYEQAQPYRERRVALWNRHAMAAEERRQRKLSILEVRLSERSAQLSMAREDRLGRKWNNWLRREECMVARISRLLRHWRRLESRQEAQEQRRQEARVEKAVRQARALDRAAERQRAAERRERWKWMNRRDLTMDDLLGRAA